MNATLTLNPASRSLVQAQARLRGMSREQVEDYTFALERENASRKEMERNRIPGQRAIDIDSVGYALGRFGRTYDAQQNLPGCRPDLPAPALAVQSRIRQAVSVNKELTGGTGMPHYAPRMMSRTWDLFNFEALDEDIRMELGPEYESCLRSTDKSQEESEASRFDKIYVNKRGHGLLHYAAAVGNVNALRHLLSKYRCNINLPNQSFSETPLVCACRAGQYDSAKFLLENGADPNGSDSGQEAPLHWISRFGRAEMRLTTKRLVDAGADMSRITDTMRKDVRRIFSDWEDRLNLPMTPLGRAVLNNSLTAVKTLLEIGSADPMEKATRKEAVNLSAIELAALLTLPEILQELLNYQDGRGGQVKVLDELDVLDMARDMSDKGVADPLTLHSRLNPGSRFTEAISLDAEECKVFVQGG
ncbi:hypothetical protein FSOLCH5_012146 [Fusarium solani]